MRVSLSRLIQLGEMPPVQGMRVGVSPYVSTTVQNSKGE